MVDRHRVHRNHSADIGRMNHSALLSPYHLHSAAAVVAVVVVFQEEGWWGWSVVDADGF